MWRSLQSRLAGLYQYIEIIFGKAPYPSGIPAENVIEAAQAVFHLLERRRNSMCLEDDEAWENALYLLNHLHEIHQLGNVVNSEGYSPFLVAVIQDDREVLKLMINAGCNLNISKCCLPLHLACLLGNTDLVKFLLANGARADRETGMCYPKPHLPIRHVPSRFHFLETDIYSCDSDHCLPLMYALSKDHVDIVKCLVEQTEGFLSTWPYHRYPLHYACRNGAYHCMQYLASVHPREVNKVDEDGLTPLLYAVVWGKKYAQLLVDAGANVLAVDGKNKGALHCLFENIQSPLELYETTRFLLGSGLEQDVNRTDHHGNTALHTLVTLVNRFVTSFGSPGSNQACHSGSQLEFNNQVIATTELLLSYNCDPNLVNNSEVTPLHKTLLLQDFVVSNDPNGITMEMLPTRGMYAVDLGVVAGVIENLLVHCADANAATGSGRSALLILLQMALNTEPTRWIAAGGVHRQDYLHCLELLCSYGAQPSATLQMHIAVITALARLGHRCLILTDLVAQSALSEFIRDLLALLLRCGLESNHRSNRRKPPAEGGSGNILLELVKLAQYIQKPADLMHIHAWVLTALQWGANPDIEPYPSDPIICHSQSSIFLKAKGTQAVNQFMYEIQDFGRIFEGGHAQNLLMLFYNSMDHEALFQAMNNTKFLSRFDPNRAPSAKFLKLISLLSSQPRSLQQMAKVAVYKAIDRKLKMAIPMLPLPATMQKILLDVC